MNKIILVRATDINDIRFNKFINAFNKNYTTIQIFIYSNTSFEKSLNINGNEWNIIKSSSNRMLRIFKNLFIWPLKLIFNKKFIKAIKNSKSIYCGDFESLTIGIYAKLVNKKIILIYDVYDEIYLRYSNSIINLILLFLENKMKLFADYIITCSHDRALAFYQDFKDKTYVIHNKPSVLDIYSARSLDEGSEHEFLADLRAKNLNRKIILAGGWLNNRRGLDKIIEFSKINHDKVVVVLYSQRNYASGENILCRPIVNQKILFSCLHFFDYQFVLYNPKYKINIYAAPNKIWDGINFGLPSIINEEILCANDNSVNKNFIIVPYNNPDLWMDIIIKYNNLPHMLNPTIEAFEDDFRKIFN